MSIIQFPAVGRFRKAAAPVSPPPPQLADYYGAMLRGCRDMRALLEHDPRWEDQAWQSAFAGAAHRTREATWSLMELDEQVPETAGLVAKLRPICDKFLNGVAMMEHGVRVLDQERMDRGGLLTGEAGREFEALAATLPDKVAQGETRNRS